MLGLAALVVASVVVPAVAADEPAANVVFEDEHAVKLRWGQLEQSVPVRLCNIGDAKAEKVIAALVGFDFKVDEVVRPVARVLTLSPPPGQPPTFGIPSGDCVALTLARGAQAPDAGDYSGVIVVRRAGAVARRDVTITGPAANATKPAAAVDEVNLRARRGDPFVDDTIGLASPRSIPLAIATGERLRVPAEGTKIGVLQNGPHRATVTVNGAPYTNVQGVRVLPIIMDAPRDIGTYTGTVDLGTGSEDSVPVKLKVEASDGWRWALLAVVIGIALSAVATWLLQHTLPRIGLNHRRRNLLDNYKEAKTDFDAHWGDATFHDYRLDEVKINAYGGKVKQSIRRYARDNILFDRASDDYKRVVRDLQTAEADATFFGAQDGFGAKLSQLEQALAAFAAAHPDSAPLFLDEAKSRLTGQPLPVNGASKIAAEADAYIALAAKWTQLAKTVRRLGAWIARLEQAPLSDPEKVTVHAAGVTLAAAKLKMRDATDSATLEQLGVERDLRHVYAQLVVLGAAHGVPQPTEAEAQAWALQIIRPELVGAAPKDIGAALRPIADQAVDVLGQTGWGLAAFGLLLFGIVSAILVALPTVLNDDTFGTWRDYVAAIGLGGAAAAASKALFDMLSQLRRDRVAA